MEFFYRCAVCERTYDISPRVMLCPQCSQVQQDGRPQRGVLDTVLNAERGRYTVEELSGGHPPWSRLLPVEARYFPDVPMGPTPLWAPARLREALGMPNLFLKDDTVLPTGSLKDRASLLVAAFARRHGVMEIVVASTGNAACSMAGIGAAAGIRVTIFLPGTAPRAKLVQALQYGARVVTVEGDYDAAYAASLEHLSAKSLSRNTGYNPLTIEGKKTVMLEVYGQLGRMPDAVFVPTGDGVILGGVYKGCEDLVQLGLADAVPKVYAIQAEGSNAISRALRDGFFAPVGHRAPTLADSIAVRAPANGHGAVRRLVQHGGECVEVSDEAILAAQRELSSRTGLFAEPAAAAPLAGLHAVRETTGSDAVVVLLITGTGLKDVESAARGLPLPPRPEGA